MTAIGINQACEMFFGVNRGHPMTALELWHRIHDATLVNGHDETEAVHRADHKHWPPDEPCPDPDVWLETSPFTEPA